MTLRAAAFLLVLLATFAAPASPPDEGVLVGTHRDATGREGAYALQLPPNRSGPIGALVFFHADDGVRDYTEWMNDRLRSLAARHNLALVSLQEPDLTCWWAPRSADDSRYALDFIDQVLVGRYGVDRRRLFLAGKSGGSFFAAGLPAYANYDFGGGIIGLCGGDVPRLNGGDCDEETDAPAWTDAPKPPSDLSLRYWFTSTSDDEWIDYSLDAAQHYASLGLHVDVTRATGGGHCEFDLESALEQALDAMDR